METIINKEMNTTKHIIKAKAGLALAGMSGILGAVAYYGFWPKPSPILVLAILTAAVLGLYLGILTRQTGLGKQAIAVGGINTIIWLVIAIAIQFAKS
jgi:hypothetical protein